MHASAQILSKQVFSKSCYFKIIGACTLYSVPFMELFISFVILLIRLLGHIQVGKRNHQLSTPPLRPQRENKDYSGFKSAPSELGKSKRKRIVYKDGRVTTPQKAKQRGGWISEDPETVPRKTKSKHWRSLSRVTKESHKTTKESHKISTTKSIGHFSSPHSSSSKASYHRYSSSRFGNYSSSNDLRRNYDWW